MVDTVINPCREKNEPRLPACGVLFVNPGEAACATRKAKAENWKRHFLFHSNLFVSSKQSAIFIAGPAVGAPMAVLCLEKLIALGARCIIVMGWCGGLTPDLAVGDVLLPTWSKSEEGTSLHYPLDAPAESSVLLRNHMEKVLASRQFRVTEGPVWTTDAPYRETREKVKRFGAEGILGVDMEFAALVQVAAFRHVDLAGALLVSDSLYREEWQPGFRGKEFRNKSKQLVHALCSCCQDLAESIS